MGYVFTLLFVFLWMVCADTKGLELSSDKLQMSSLDLQTPLPTLPPRQPLLPLQQDSSRSLAPNQSQLPLLQQLKAHRNHQLLPCLPRLLELLLLLLLLLVLLLRRVQSVWAPSSLVSLDLSLCRFVILIL